MKRFTKVQLLLFAVCVLSSCSGDVQAPPGSPPTFLWAWERPEDLRFLDPKTHGVAFLAQTIDIEGSQLRRRPRFQPLDISNGTYLIAVTRIEAKSPSLSVQDIDELVRLLARSAEQPNVRTVQIDFDARETEREFYRTVIVGLRKALPAEVPISITALTSWCMGDRWLQDLPVAEAVPMMFDMGPDRDEVLRVIAGGDDWNEPLCRSSYGLSVNGPRPLGLKPSRRMYYFNAAPWKPSDLERIGK